MLNPKHDFQAVVTDLVWGLRSGEITLPGEPGPCEGPFHASLATTMSTPSDEASVAFISQPADAALKAAALQAASPVVLALYECDEELRAEAIDLFKQLNSGELDAGERQATLAHLAEILFRDADDRGLPGLDLEDAEGIAKRISPEAGEVLARMDREEATFATRLRGLMDQKGMTQEQLAKKIGVGQPAIFMMLQRQCRPQKRTVLRLAGALGVTPEQLWPGHKER